MQSGTSGRFGSPNSPGWTHGKWPKSVKFSTCLELSQLQLKGPVFTNFQLSFSNSGTSGNSNSGSLRATQIIPNFSWQWYLVVFAFEGISISFACGIKTHAPLLLYCHAWYGHTRQSFSIQPNDKAVPLWIHKSRIAYGVPSEVLHITTGSSNKIVPKGLSDLISWLYPTGCQLAYNFKGKDSDVEFICKYNYYQSTFNNYNNNVYFIKLKMNVNFIFLYIVSQNI